VIENPSREHIKTAGKIKGMTQPWKEMADPGIDPRSEPIELAA
jgi:hypothetical protein